ncbi:MAG: alpha-L-fucosidase [Candidatus Omnitrophota bacterium]
MKTFPKRAIHLDFHTMPGVYDVGRDFKAEEFAGTLKRAGVEYITVFARCNLGFAYYPTKIGTPHPGLKKPDLLGPMVEACHKENIRVAAYLNAGLDHEHAVRHREWCKLNKEGQVYEMQAIKQKQQNNFFRRMCLNTGYGEHILGMVQEVVTKYPVDGIFLDCFTHDACYGVECLDGMKQLGMDPFDEHQAQEFCRIVTARFRKEATKLVKKSRKDAYLYFNGLPYQDQPDHIELEVLPTGGWGYDILPFSIRYARTMKKPYLTMTGRFHESWGDFGGLRPEHSLLFDCYNSLANAGTCMVGDHMHPKGRLEPAVYNLIGKVYNQIKPLEPWTYDAKPLTDIVVVDPALRRFPSSSYGYDHLAGTTRMLMELKYQFNISLGDEDLSPYKVVVLPDRVLVDGKLKEKLQKYLKSGGTIISSASSGLNPEKTNFALKEYRITYEGPEPYHYSFFKPLPEINRDLPEMLTTIYNPGIAMKPGKGTRVLAKLYQPYFNLASWDWYHENLYIPPEKDSGRPALVRCGNIFHFSFPIFFSYFEHAVVAYKNLVRNCLEKTLTKPLVKVLNFPSFGQVTVTQKDKSRMVHLLTYLPELRGKKIQIIEEPIKVKNVEVALRTDGQKISGIYLAPSRKKLEFKQDNGYVTVTVPEVNGYQMVVFE